MFIFFDVRNLFAVLPFAAVSVLHLIYCFHRKDKKADFTKFALMPLLIIAFCVWCFYLKININVLLIITAALIFSWLGDVFLVFDAKKIYFILGVLSFAASQILYSVSSIIFLFAFEFPVFQFAAVLCIYLFFAGFTIFRLRRGLKNLIFIVSFYAALISIMSLSFITLAFAAPSAQTICSAAGSLCFVTSDSLLSLSVFAGKGGRIRFFVMLTYLLAQFLIVLGITGFVSA